MSDSKEQEPIDIKDRRRFNPDGSMRDDKTEEKSGPKEESPPAAEPRQKGPSSGSDFQINFSTFILSLASSVQISLGIIPHPATGKPSLSLPSAKQTIDILGLLEEKTKGNLSPEEGNILKQILFELRMQYVEVVGKAKGGNKK